MVESLFKIFELALGLWADHEKNKYAQEFMDLKTEWYEEFNKPYGSRDDAKLDRIELKLRILVTSFGTAVSSKNALAKS